MQFDKKINLIKETGLRINRIPKNKKRIIRLKQRMRWEKKWNLDNEDDTPERIVFNEKQLKINQKRAATAVKKEVTLLKRERRVLNRSILTDKQIKSKYGHNYYFHKKKKQEKKEEKERFHEKVKKLEEKVEEIKNMPVE